MKTLFRSLCLVLLLAGNSHHLHSQWVQHSGPTWGSANCFAFSGGTVFLGTEHGVFSSADNGRSWSPAGTGLPADYVQAFAVSGTTLFASEDYGGIFRSTDNGKSWIRISTDTMPNQILSLAVSGNNIFAGTYGEVFRSTFDGTEWTAASTGLPTQGISALAVIGTELFAGTKGGGVFRSSDNGANWTAANTGLTGNDVYALTVSDSNLFAATYGEGVFRSTDKGASWTAVNSGLSGGTVNALAVAGSDLFAATNSGGIFRTTDNGAHWTEVNTGMTLMNVKALAASDTLLFAGGWYGDVFRSMNNGDNWELVSTSITYAPINSVVVSGDTIFAGTVLAGVYRSADGGASWLPSNAGLTNGHISSLIFSGNSFFAGTDSGIFISASKGTSWSSVNTGLTRMHVNVLFAAGTDLFAGTDSGVFISANNGANWSEANTGLTAKAGAIPAVLAFTVSGANLFAGTTAGVYRSADNGAHWAAAGLAMTRTLVCALAEMGGYVFAGTAGPYVSGTVYRSADNGGTWTEVDSGFTNNQVLSFYIRNGKIFAGTNEGIFVSADSGTSWKSAGSGLGNYYIRSLAASGSRLLAGTAWGVWSRPLGDFDIPAPPILLSPADSSTGQPVPYIELVWAASPHALTYLVQVSLDSTFASAVYRQTSGTPNGCSIGDLLKNETYYWRVRADNEMGSSAWSKTWSFSTIGLGSPIVTLVSPSDGSSTDADNVTFVWRPCTAHAWSYRLEMYRENYSTFVEILDTSFRFFVPPNLSAKTYSWRVRARTDSGWGPYSDVWTFTKLRTDVPDSGSTVNRIHLVCPLNGSRAGGDSVRFTWRKPAVPCPLFALEIWASEYNYLPTNDTTVMFALPENADTIYSWRVRSYSDTSSYSSLWSFTKLSTSAPHAEPVPTEFALSNNYPNPFNPSTTFSFALPLRSFVSLKLFDVLGREVATVVSEALPAGSYERRWDASGYQSGVYLYRLQAGAFSETKRLVILK